jgi:uncharacterized membrane protein SpoIIM required for sporulation
MLEMLINPKRAERAPWELFFIGLFYASISILLVTWIFSQDAVLASYSGILVITFTVICSMPFMYYTVKLEEKKDVQYTGFLKLLKEHRKALYAFMWLFLGFVVAYSAWYMLLPSENTFKAQIETYCVINRPANFNACVNQYTGKVTASTTGTERIFTIFTNNIYVLIFTLVFSLIFGAGAMFILAWNASVIAAAVGIFTKSKIIELPLGIARYMIHGIPEIGAYFIGAIAGGIIGIAIIRKDTRSNRFWDILQDSLNLIILAVVVLFIAALIEVYITPLLF